MEIKASLKLLFLCDDSPNIHAAFVLKVQRTSHMRDAREK